MDQAGKYIAFIVALDLIVFACINFVKAYAGLETKRKKSRLTWAIAQTAFAILFVYIGLYAWRAS